MAVTFDPRHLALLRELASRGSITAVAAATYRTPSAVSQQLRTASRDLGIAVVERKGRDIQLTEAGKLMAEAAIDVDIALERARTHRGLVAFAPGCDSYCRTAKCRRVPAGADDHGTG